MRLKIYSILKRFALLLLFAAGSIIDCKAQAISADPGLGISPSTNYVTLGNIATVDIQEANYGSVDPDDSIAANSLVITLSVLSNLEITGIDVASSDPRWTVASITSGPGNTIKLKNIATLLVWDIRHIYVTVKGVAVSGKQLVAANISYLSGTNPLIGNRQNAAQGNGTTGDDNSSTLMGVSAVPLPVHLISFTGTPLPGKCAAQLEWVTGEEKNFDHFTVLYSTDGRQFQPAGQVKSNGNPMGSKYNFKMEQPASRVYYRLQMVDIDGTSEYSKIESVSTQCDANASETTWQVYPNIATTGRNVNLQYIGSNNSKQALKVLVSDVQGRKIWTGNLIAAPGKNVYSVPSGSWSSGTYFVNLYDQNGNVINHQVQKIILN